MIRSKIAREIFGNCLLKESDLETIDVKNDVVYGEAYGKKIPFNKAKINEYKNQIKEMTKGFPKDLKNSWEFMNLCLPAENYLWTNIHEVCEKVILLGVAAGEINDSSLKEDSYLIPMGKKISKNPIATIVKDFNSRGSIGMYKSWTIAGNVRIRFMPKMERIEIPFQKG